MRALTVKQPWAWAIIHAGKSVENRSRPTKYRGELLIHAGLAWDDNGPLRRHDGGKWPDPSVFVYGAIIGKVTVVGCCTNSSSPWAAAGMWHWLLADPVPFAEPIPCRGMLGLWTPPAEAMAA